MTSRKIYLKVSEDDPDVAYLYLPGHPGEGKRNVVDKQIRLFDIIENFKGPDLYLDFDTGGNLIGIEILS
jgi:hypothetical protein